jgi:hypothetical protein
MLIAMPGTAVRDYCSLHVDRVARDLRRPAAHSHAHDPSKLACHEALSRLIGA